MTEEQLIRNLHCPAGKIDMVLDTDAYNEIDDQFAIAYMLRSPEKLNVKEIYAAPFFNQHSTSPEDGMKRSYDEILKILDLAGCSELKQHVYLGSRTYLQNEKEPVDSPAARALVALSASYTPEHPLYVAAIGAITNVASALLLDPTMRERIVIVWLGGHGIHCPDTNEFNMRQDVAAARVVFGCGAPVVQLPCGEVVEAFTVSGAELEHFLAGKNPLSDYLAKNTIAEAEVYAKGRPWTRTIWDVTTIAWLLDDKGRFMRSQLIPAPIPEYDNHYGFDSRRHFIRYVSWIYRDALMADLFDKLTH